MRPSGRINLVSLALIAAVGAGFYWVFIFSPVYLDNLDVREAIDVAYNLSPRTSDEILRRTILERLNQPTLGSHQEDDGFGNLSVVGGLGIKPEQVIIERDEVRKRILIRVEYEREIQLKPTERVRTIQFDPEKEGPIP